MSTKHYHGDLADRELLLTRTFNASPDKVFRAWTESEFWMVNISKSG